MIIILEEKKTQIQIWKKINIYGSVLRKNTVDVTNLYIRYNLYVYFFQWQWSKCLSELIDFRINWMKS